MKHIFIINPIAGNGKKQLVLASIIKSNLSNKNIDFEIYYTTHKGSIKEYLDSNCSNDIPYVIYACGGDGTLHEVINAVILRENISVGIIPCGSGNDFVKNFSNANNFLNTENQLEGESVYLDIIKIEDKYAASVCNIGLDADAAFNMHKFKKVPFISGSTRYYLAVLYCLINKLGKTLEITINDNEVLNGSYLLGVVANGQYYGGGYKCAPLASIKDGLMDLCLVDNISRLKILNLIGNYKLGEHLNNPSISKYITYRQIHNIKLKGAVPLNICIDGESYIYKEVEMKIERNKLKFWLPKGVQLLNICHSEGNA